ncbi:hypothetical protein [Aquimarina sediminis]|uniref:hypothetical protein n=1 Tax=Aquimarina sediminis TaxID=2070536 RepID=UPI000CA07B4E|nr:hypothetical protein [Aquimarina sediminis]
MKNVFFLATMILIFFSCNKEDLTSEIQTEEISIIYNETEYKTSLDEHDQLQLSELNENVQNAIINGHSLELANTNAIYLFDSKVEKSNFIKQHLGLTDVKVDNSKVPTPTRVVLFTHKNFGGGKRVEKNDFSIKNLKKAPYHYDNVISSSKVRNKKSSFYYVVIFYEHKNYLGSSHTIIVYPNSNNKLSDFKTVGFDNKTSSIKGFFLR